MVVLNIVFPIAGRGSRFLEAGYSSPKPLIPVHGIPMIEVVANNVRPKRRHRMIFLPQQEHLNRYGVRDALLEVEPNATIVPVPEVTEGAACTVLLASDLINTSDPLMIVNNDQWVDSDINEYLEEMEGKQADGLIMTMWADHPKWSYVALDERGLVTRVVEKQVISNDATVGIYNFRKGSDFVQAAERMIAENVRVNNEFYIAPVYNELIADGANVAAYNVGRVSAGMWGLGTPSDLKLFLADPVSYKAAGLPCL